MKKLLAVLATLLPVACAPSPAYPQAAVAPPVILFVLVFTDGAAPQAQVAPMPSMVECERQRIALTEDIVKSGKVSRFVAACHQVLKGDSA